MDLNILKDILNYPTPKWFKLSLGLVIFIVFLGKGSAFAQGCEHIGTMTFIKGKVKVFHTLGRTNVIYKSIIEEKKQKIVKLDISKFGRITRTVVPAIKPLKEAICYGDYIYRQESTMDSDDDIRNDVSVKFSNDKAEEDRFGENSIIKLYPDAFVFLGQLIKTTEIQDIKNKACSTYQHVWAKESKEPQQLISDEADINTQIDDGMIGLQMKDMKIYIFKEENKQWEFLFDKPFQLLAGKVFFDFAEKKGMCTPRTIAWGETFTLQVDAGRVVHLNELTINNQNTTFRVMDNLFADDTSLVTVHNNIEKTRERMTKKNTQKEIVKFSLSF
jgi:hypothetical protein